MKRPYLNLGCGNRYDKRWTNVDIGARGPDVISYDISKKIPFPDEHFEMVYHSAVLEHIRRKDVPGFVRECFRVLKPGGVIRIAVPDLERLCRAYLQKLELAMEGRPGASFDYQWLLLELYDQTVREVSGGEMGEWLRAGEPPNKEFIISRIGVESGYVGQSAKKPMSASSILLRVWWRRFKKMGQFLRDRTLDLWIGPSRRRALDIGQFRLSGQVHQWMYDRFSLSEVLRQAGFVDPVVRSASESRVPDWNEFELDVLRDGTVIKPDLLIMEAVRPRT